MELVSLIKPGPSVGSVDIKYYIFEQPVSFGFDNNGNPDSFPSAKFSQSNCYITNDYGQCMVRHQDIRVLVGTTPNNVSEATLNNMQRYGQVSLLQRPDKYDFTHAFLYDMAPGTYYFQLGVRPEGSSNYTMQSNIVRVQLNYHY
jgi:hypothetical protein